MTYKDGMCQHRFENIPVINARTGRMEYVSFTCFRPQPCEIHKLGRRMKQIAGMRTRAARFRRGGRKWKRKGAIRIESSRRAGASDSPEG